ncbi:MAG: hypothetical protein V5A43_02635, partial [Haloarculaceae archaeon]
ACRALDRTILATSLLVACRALDRTSLSTSLGVLGLVIGVHASRGFRQNDSGPMQYLSIGFILLTAVPFTTSFGGRIALAYCPEFAVYRRHLTLLAEFLQLGGVALITDSLYEKRSVGPGSTLTGRRVRVTSPSDRKVVLTRSLKNVSVSNQTD